MSVVGRTIECLVGEVDSDGVYRTLPEWTGSVLDVAPSGDLLVQITSAREHGDPSRMQRRAGDLVYARPDESGTLRLVDRGRS